MNFGFQQNYPVAFETSLFIDLKKKKQITKGNLIALRYLICVNDGKTLKLE